jgi:hypothetical protein
MELNPLSLASTDDLVEELKRRFDKTLIVGLQERPGADHFFLDYRGLTTCIGLAERAKARMLEVALSPSSEDLPEAED